jgi:uncharacterized repeat protein (TIGR04052 family)
MMWHTSVLTISLLAVGCGAGTQPVSLRVAAVVGTEPFACGRTYHGLGATGTDWDPSDFRLYVHDLRLLGADGREVPLELDEDGVWQHAGVALLDFEDGSGGCANGTAATHATLDGRAPAGEYRGVRFRIGVPFASNHADASVAAPPLDVSGLFWDWLAGYKFVRIEGRSTGLPTGWNVHLGSTGCDGDRQGHVSGCAQENVPEVTLTGFDPETQPIRADLAALLASADLDANTPTTPPGCMSSPGDPECAQIFPRLGLPYDASSGAPEQRFFVAP